MHLTVVGCAGSYPNHTAAASCYLVEHDGFALVLDMGSGALGPLHRYLDPCHVDTVLLSHLHADHFLDMCPLFVVRRYQPSGMPASLPVYGPRDTADRLQAAYGSEPEPLLGEVFSIANYPDGEFSVGPFSVTAVPVVHPVESFALRISAGGRTLVYSGDTAPCPQLVSIAEGADVALFEASFRDGDDYPAGLHMTARQAAEQAQQAGVARLILTHLVAWHDNQGVRTEAAGFPGELLIAEPGLRIEI